MVDESNELGDSVVPIYELSWENGTTRMTDDDVVQEPALVELLAEWGRDDPSCEVTLVGYST